MGNELFKDFDVDKDPISDGGQSTQWKVYNATKRDKSKKNVAIFIFEKKSIDKSLKKHKESIYTFMRQQVQKLQKFRHPGILAVAEPLREDEKSMVFMTEPVQYSMITMMRKNISQFYDSDMQIKMNMEFLMETVQFLHNDVKMSHLGISPENIYICPDGRYKLGGFIFSTPQIDVHSNKMQEIQNVDMTNQDLDKFLQFYPNLRFMPPEIIENPPKCHIKSDIFSLAILIMTIYKCKYDEGCKNCDILDIKYKSDYENAYNKAKKQINLEPFFQNFPQSFKLLLNQMINSIIGQRPNIEQILQSEWLNDPYIKALKHLDKISQMENNKQLEFLKGFQQILFKYDRNILTVRIIPQILDLIKFTHLIPAILYLIVEMMKKDGFLTLMYYQEKIQPTLQQILKGKQVPAKALFIIIQQLGTLFKFVEKNFIQQDYLPIIIKCYECNAIQIQEMVLNQTKLIVEHIDYNYTKTQIMPRILRLCLGNSLKLRKMALNTLKNIFSIIDKTTLQDKVLATLHKIKNAGVDQEMTMIILDLYEQIAKQVSLEIIGTKLLPQLIPYLMDQNLRRQEFIAYCNTVKSLVNLIQDERLKILDDSAVPKIEEPQDDAQAAQMMQEGITIKNNGNEFEFLNQFENMNKTPYSQNEQEMQQNTNQQVFGKNNKNNQQAQMNQQNDVFSSTSDSANFKQQLNENNLQQKQQLKNNSQQQQQFPQQKIFGKKQEQKNQVQQDFFNVKQLKQQKNEQINDDFDFLDNLDQQQPQKQKQTQIQFNKNQISNDFQLENKSKVSKNLTQQPVIGENKNLNNLDDDLWGDKNNQKQSVDNKNNFGQKNNQSKFKKNNFNQTGIPGKNQQDSNIVQNKEQKQQNGNEIDDLWGDQLNTEKSQAQNTLQNTMANLIYDNPSQAYKNNNNNNYDDLFGEMVLDTKGQSLNQTEIFQVHDQTLRAFNKQGNNQKKNIKDDFIDDDFFDQF